MRVNLSTKFTASVHTSFFRKHALARVSLSEVGNVTCPVANGGEMPQSASGTNTEREHRLERWC